MAVRGRFQQRWVAMLIGAVLTAGLGLSLHTFQVGSGLAHMSYDLLPVLRGDVAVDGAVIVYLDEKSHRDLGQPLNAPWDRELHARLIERLTAAGARAIVFDVVFSDPSSNRPAADQRLADAMRASGRVILGADNISTGPRTKQMIRPFDLLLDSAAGVGSVEVLPSSDLVVRQHTPEEQLPSLSWATAEFLKLPVTQPENAARAPAWLNYYGPPNALPWVSYADALDPARAPAALFRNQVVFVGARIMTRFAGERKDEYRNPFTYWTTRAMAEERGSMFISGVEIQATALVNLLRGDGLRRWSLATERGLMLVLGALLGAVLVWFRPMVATGLAVGGWGFTTGFFYVLYRYGLTWFPWLLVWEQIFAALCWSVLYNSVQLYVQKRLIEHTLGLYLSPKLVRRFSGNPDLLKVGAEKHVLTLFFSDIAQFTSLSEGVNSDDLARVMNQYFQAAVAECIHKTDGTVVKYIGDAIFAFWNAPEPQGDHARRACEAALRFREHVHQHLAGQRLRTRIGLHTGVANVGNFGSADRVDYTALGENVNLASRLEGLNKYLGTDCLISGTTREAAGDGLVTRDVGRYRLKGFEKAVDVHELVGSVSAEAATRPWRDAFAGALKAFRNRDWSAAEAGFRHTLELRPADGPSQFYLGRLAELRARPAPEPWTGEVELKEK